MERLIKAGHLKRYVREVDRRAESVPIADKITTDEVAPSESRLAINYILGGPFDNQYQSKRQQKKLLRVATVKAQVNAVHTRGSREGTKLIDGLISFPPVNPNRVIVPHYDALVLALCIRGFDVHRVLVDPGNTTNLLQLPAFNQMKLSSRMLNSIGRVLSGFNDATTGFVLIRPRPRALQLHSRPDLAALVKGRPFNISPDSQLFDQCRTG